MRIVFLLTHIPNPRMNKRLSLAREVGEVFVICTRRKSQDAYESAIDGVTYFVYDIDLPSSKHLLKRALVSVGFQKKAQKKLGEIRPDLLYAEGLDPLIIANRYCKKHDTGLFFEVADLRECFAVRPTSLPGRLKSRFIAHKEKANFRFVEYLVITSEKFYRAHYNQLIGRDRVLFLPNAPDPEPFRGYRKKESGPFTVGFIGGIRYLDQMKMLADAAKTAGCEVLFAGAGGTSGEYDEIRRYCSGMEHVRFTGKYDYNSEIANLYGMVDCVFSVYDADNPNVRIALPNKLYESVLCGLPILAAKGTYLSEIVDSFGIGLSVPCRDTDALVRALTRLKEDPGYREEISKNCARCRKELLNTAEKNRLLKEAMGKASVPDSREENT